MFISSANRSDQAKETGCFDLATFAYYCQTPNLLLRRRIPTLREFFFVVLFSSSVVEQTPTVRGEAEADAAVEVSGNSRLERHPILFCWRPRFTLIITKCPSQPVAFVWSGIRRLSFRALTNTDSRTDSRNYL